MNVSNKFLTVLVVIAIVVTIIGAWLSIEKVNQFARLTGFPVNTGNVTVNITQKIELNVTQPNCDFGSGYVTPPYSYAVLHPGNGTVGIGCRSNEDTKDNWTVQEGAYAPDCMVVRNDGNVRLWINVSSGKDAATFIGGNNPNVTAWSENKETTLGGGGCASTAMVYLVPYPGVEMDTTNKTMCSCFLPDDDRDELYIGCYLKIPDNAAPGAKSDAWTFWAEPARDVPDCGR